MPRDDLAGDPSQPPPSLPLALPAQRWHLQRRGEGRHRFPSVRFVGGRTRGGVRRVREGEGVGSGEVLHRDEGHAADLLCRAPSRRPFRSPLRRLTIPPPCPPHLPLLRSLPSAIHSPPFSFLFHVARRHAAGWSTSTRLHPVRRQDVVGGRDRGSTGGGGDGWGSWGVHRGGRGGGRNGCECAYGCRLCGTKDLASSPGAAAADEGRRGHGWWRPAAAARPFPLSLPRHTPTASQFPSPLGGSCRYCTPAGAVSYVLVPVHTE